MIEPITATAAAYIADRVYDRTSRVFVQRKLMALALRLPPGSEVGETLSGWYIKTPPSPYTGDPERV
jgi:hypothetical protein